MRIKFETRGVLPAETYKVNAERTSSSGLPMVGKTGGGSLAVCGGGPSLLSSLEKLKDFDAVWGINLTARFLEQHDIPCTLFSVDPQYHLGLTDGVRNAILGSCCDERTFAELEGRVAWYPTEFDTDASWRGVGGPTSACRTPLVALKMGYSSITFFGCEGSHGETSHVYAYENRPDAMQLIVRASGRDYITEPEYYVQCECLSKLITELPEVYREESGGLLRAMIEHPDSWEVVALSGALAEHMGIDLQTLHPYQEAA